MGMLRGKFVDILLVFFLFFTFLFWFFAQGRGVSVFQWSGGRLTAPRRFYFLFLACLCSFRWCGYGMSNGCAPSENGQHDVRAECYYSVSCGCVSVCVCALSLARILAALSGTNVFLISPAVYCCFFSVIAPSFVVFFSFIGFLDHFPACSLSLSLALSLSRLIQWNTNIGLEEKKLLSFRGPDIRGILN